MLKLKYSLLLLMIFVIVIGGVSAEALPHTKNTDLKFSITSNNATSCILTTINTPTNVTIINQTGTRSSQTFNFTLLSGNFTELGNYEMNIECSDGLNIVSGKVEREVEGGNMALFIILISISLTLLLFAFLFKSPWLSFTSGALMAVTGVYIMIYGFQFFSDLYTRSIAYTLIGIGSLFVIISGFDVMTDW